MDMLYYSMLYCIMLYYVIFLRPSFHYLDQSSIIQAKLQLFRPSFHYLALPSLSSLSLHEAHLNYATSSTLSISYTYLNLSYFIIKAKVTKLKIPEEPEVYARNICIWHRKFESQQPKGLESKKSYLRLQTIKLVSLCLQPTHMSPPLHHITAYDRFNPISYMQH